MKLYKGKCEVLTLRRNNPRHWYTLRTNWLESDSAQKNLGGSDGQQAEHQTAIHLGGKEGQWNPGLH